MQTHFRRGLLGTLIAGGLLALGSTAASASGQYEDWPTVPSVEASTSGDHSVLSGNQVVAPVTAPVTLGATSVAVLGDSTATNNGGSSNGGTTYGGTSNGGTTYGGTEASTSGDHSVLSGNQVVAPVTAPVTLGATSVAVLGDSTATNNGGSNNGGSNNGGTNNGGTNNGGTNNGGTNNGGDCSWCQPAVMQPVVHHHSVVQRSAVHVSVVTHPTDGFARASAIKDAASAKGAVQSAAQGAATGTLAVTGASLQWLPAALWLLLAGLLLIPARRYAWALAKRE